ncbi:MAG TPA: GGDEF domain-containing protein [Leptolyngbyaceae cyanobacterium]
MLIALMPHGSCFLWDPWLTFIHAVADGGIALSYFSIPILLLIYRDRATAEMRPLLMLFAAFILSCGVGHVLAAWNIWHSRYWIEGGWKWVTMTISGYTAWRLRSTLPHLLTTRKDLETTRALLERDPLTGVSNRRGLETAFDRIASCYNASSLAHTMVLLDLDGFKQVNDTYGHHVGDALLKAVAEALCDRTRTLDTVARLGGDEFALLLTGCSLNGARLIAEEIRQTIALLTIPELPAGPSVTVSIGIAEFHADTSLEACYIQADQALYQAKNGGKNQLSLASVTCPVDLVPGKPA